MIEVCLADGEQVHVTAAPKSAWGETKALAGSLTCTVVSGPGIVTPVQDEALEFILTLDDTVAALPEFNPTEAPWVKPGTVEARFLVAGDGVRETIVVHKESAAVASLGVTVAVEAIPPPE